MKKNFLIGLVLVFGQAGISPSGAQNSDQALSPGKYIPFLEWLASPALEGRETGSRGEAQAADSIAAEMHLAGLSPWNPSPIPGNVPSGYFQQVRIHRFLPLQGTVSVYSTESSSGIQLVQGKDFITEFAFSDLDLTCPLVFAGYGIGPGIPGFNDYRGLDVSGKGVLIRDGYPKPSGNKGSLSNSLSSLEARDGYDLAARSREAFTRGAVVLLVIPEGFDPGAEKWKQEELPYLDAHYKLHGTKLPEQAPLLLLTPSGARSLLHALHLRKGWKPAGKKRFPAAVSLKDHIGLKIDVAADTLDCNNVIGVLPGMDTSRCIVIGAHHDHLGKRGEVLYPGADDNASGVAGLLALAASMAGKGSKPPCNIVFASWTAEEKGHLGSKYFVSALHAPGKVKLYINLDMISRSESGDSTRRMLSIGTRTADGNLRETAQKCNARITPPFNLDLWDVTGRHGSDYASFTAAGIPIMTFNTGLHEDYHTPRDVPEAVDMDKMGRVLQLVNLILTLF